MTEFEQTLSKITTIWELHEIDLEYVISMFKAGHQSVAFSITSPDGDTDYQAWAFADSSVKINKYNEWCK